MRWESIGNIIEAFFMLGVSVFFIVPLCRRKEPNRWFCFYGMMVFFSSAGSDFFEAYTGAWWRPWWLIVWNALTGVGVAGIVFWYIRIRGSFKAVVEEFNKPLSSFAPKKRKATQGHPPTENDNHNIPRKANAYKLLIVFCCLFIIVSSVLSICLSGAGRGWMNRTFFAPEAIKDNRIVLLETAPEQRKQSISNFFDSNTSKTGFCGFKLQKHTIEGDPLWFYVITTNGQAQIVIDYTRDRYSNRDFKQFIPVAIKPGYKDDNGNFVEVADNHPQDENFALKLEHQEITLYIH